MPALPAHAAASTAHNARHGPLSAAGAAPALEEREPEFFSRQITEARRFFLRHDQHAEPLAVVCGGKEHCAADYHIARRNFPYYAVEFVSRGEGRVRLGEGALRAAQGAKEFPLSAGAVFVYGPDVPHDIQCNAKWPLEKYFVSFTGSAARQHLQGGTPSPGEIVQSAAPADILDLFEQLIDAGRRETPYRPRICVAILQHLLLRIAESAVPLGTIGTDAFETFRRCREWIDANYRQVESLAEVAERCHTDGAYICRLFKRFAYQSPWQYVLRLKMRDAAHRLQSSDVRVSDVAREFGFGDPFQFSRTFRRVFGVSPRTFARLQVSRASPANP